MTARFQIPAVIALIATTALAVACHGNNDDRPGGPPAILVAPAQVSFGCVKIGETGRAGLAVWNVGVGEPLVVSIVSTLAQISLVPDTLNIPRFGLQHVGLTLACSSAGTVTGSLIIESNDPDRSIMDVPVIGSCGSSSNECPCLSTADPPCSEFGPGQETEAEECIRCCYPLSCDSDPGNGDCPSTADPPCSEFGPGQEAEAEECIRLCYP